jgi:uncharacterized membrane protein YpjA
MKRSYLIISFIILVDLLGIFYGYYYYAEQLGATPLYLWIFVPDCPLYIMLFTIALMLAILGFESKLFSYIAAVGMMKYGIWTLAALLLYGEYFFSSSAFLLSSFLFMLHIGMTLEGPVLVPKKLSKWHLSVALLWFLANDYVDYFYGFVDNFGRYTLGTHPILPPAGRIPIIMAITFLLSILLCFLTYRWSLGDARWVVRKELEEVRKEFQRVRKSSGGSRRSSR